MHTFIKKNIGIIAVLILGFVPVLRWFFISPASPRFSDLNSTSTILGQIAGIAGMAFFALNLILAGRLKILDRFFAGGLADIYGTHQKIGQISFCLLLFHPLFLVVKFLSFSLKSAALFFVPQGFDAQSYGIIALSLMIVFIGLTLYAKMKYQNWKLSHKFMVLTFIVAVLHAFLITSDISRDNFLRFYILGISAIGLAVSFCQAFLSELTNKNFNYKIKSVLDLNGQVTQIKLEAKSRRIEFSPGQFIFAKFFSKAVSRESHPFSISSPPAQKNLEMDIKSLGDFTANVKNLKPGNLVKINGPFGKFSYKYIKNKNQIWLAGGVGITPFLSMARSSEISGYKIDLYYCTKNKEEAVLIDELVEIGSKNVNFRIIPWYSDEKGFISAEIVSKQASGVSEKDIFLCGPMPFMMALRKQFLNLKVKDKNIHWENFGFF